MDYIKTNEPSYDWDTTYTMDNTIEPSFDGEWDTVAPKTDFSPKIREAVLTAAPTGIYMPTGETKPVEYIPTDAATAAATWENSDMMGSVTPLDTMEYTKTNEPSYDWDTTYTMDNTIEPSYDWDTTYDATDYHYTMHPEEWDNTYDATGYHYTMHPEEWDNTYDHMDMYNPSPAAVIHDDYGYWVDGTYYPNGMAPAAQMHHMPPHDGYHAHVAPMMHHSPPHHEIMHHMPYAHHQHHYMEVPTQDGSDLHYPSEDPMTYDMHNAGSDYDLHYPSEDPMTYDMHNAGSDYDYKTYADEHSGMPHDESEYGMHTDGYEHDGGHSVKDHKDDDLPECLKDCAGDFDFEDEISMCEWWMVEGPKYNVESCFNDCSPGVLHVASEEFEQMCSEEHIAEEDREDPLECVMDCPIDNLDPHSAESFCPWFEKERKNGCFHDCSDEFLNMAQEHAEYTCKEWEANEFTNFYINEAMADGVAEENRDYLPLCPAGFIKKEDRCEVCPAATFSIAATFER